MKKRNMIMAICAIITMGLAIPLGAQTSNQNKATAGVFKTDVDNYMSVKSWDKVKFDKWFSYFGGDHDGKVNMGYATNLGGIYLGGFYEGKIIDTDIDETKVRTTEWDENLQQMLTQEDSTTYSRESSYGWTKTNNNIAAFIGVAGMGIKVGFYENVSTANTPYNLSRIDWSSGSANVLDTTTSTVTQNSDGSVTYSGNDTIGYEESYGVLNPYLQWGMKLDVGGYVLTPRVTANVSINRSTFIDEYYSQERTEKDEKIIGVKEITRKNDNYGSVGLDIGVGADFYLKDTTYFGIDYVIGLNFFGQDYDGGGKSGTIDGTFWSDAVSRTTDSFVETETFESLRLGATERDKITHKITPSFWNTKTVMDDLKVGLLVKVPITITSETTNTYQDYYETKEIIQKDTNLSSKNEKTIYEEHKAGTKTEESTFAIAPTVGIGASYALVPDKFTVNAGVNLRPIAYKSTSKVISSNGINTTYTKKEIGSDGNQYTGEETKTVDAPTTVVDTVNSTSVWTGLSGNISAGFVFKFYDSFSLDMSVITYSGFNLALTDVNVLFTLKF